MNQNHHHQPPQWASRLLELLIQDVANTPAGDYEEYYSALVNSSGLRAARRWYFGQLLRLVPERIGARIYWNMAMWRNYLTVGRRNLLRNRVSSTINLFGLSVAIASCIVVFLFVKDFATIDHFHEHAERVFMVNHEAEPPFTHLSGGATAEIGLLFTSGRVNWRFAEAFWLISGPFKAFFASFGCATLASRA